MADERARADEEVERLNAGLKRGVGKAVKGAIAVFFLFPVAIIVSFLLGYLVFPPDRNEIMTAEPLVVVIPALLLQSFFIFRWWLR